MADRDQEYAMLVKAQEINPAAADFSHEELSDSLAVELQKTVREVSEVAAKMEPGNWELMSHSLARFDRTLLITFLIRRWK